MGVSRSSSRLWRPTGYSCSGRCSCTCTFSLLHNLQQKNENSVTVTVTPSTTLYHPVQITFPTPIEAASMGIVSSAFTSPSSSPSTLDLEYPVGSEILHVTGNLPINSPPVSMGLGIINTTTHFLRLLSYTLLSHNISINNLDGSSGVCQENNGWRTILELNSPSLSQMMEYTLLNRYQDLLFVA